MHRHRKLVKKILYKFLHVLFVVLVFSFFISGIIDKKIASSDFSPFAGNFFSATQSFLYVWDDVFTGGYAPSNYLHLIRTVFEIINNAVLAQTLFLLFFFSISYYGIYIIFKKHGYDKLIKIIVPFFYIFNPAISSELINGYTGAIIIYSLIPWLFIATHNVFTKYSYRWGFLLSVITAILILNIQIAFWIFVFLGLFILFYLFDNRKNFIKKVLRIMFCGFLGVALNIVSVLTLFNYAGNFSNSSYISTFKYTYSQTYFLNLFKMLGNHGSQQASMGYYDPGFVSILFLLFFILVVYYFSKKSQVIKSLHEKILILFSFSSLLLIMFLLVSIRLGYFDDLIKNNNVFIVSLRSPIKLFYMYAFNFVILIGFAMNYFLEDIQKVIKNNKLIKSCIFIGLVILYSSFNSHFFDRDFGYVRIMKNDAYYITEKYERLFHKIDSIKDGSYFLYLPFDYPIQLKTTWSKNIVRQRMGSKMTQEGDNDLIAKTYESICSEDISPLLTNDLNISYIILDKNPSTYHSHKPNDCSIIDFYGTSYVWGSYDYFDQLFKDFNVWYEDKDYKVVALGNVDLTAIAVMKKTRLDLTKQSPVDYTIDIHRLGEGSNNLIFKKLYHKGWSLYIKNIDSESVNFLSYLYKKPVFDDTHHSVNEYANGWIIDPEYIKQNFPKEYYKENPDGSMDVELVLYFKPQSYFYLGLIISGTTLFGCFGYLIYDWRKRKIVKLIKNNDKENP